MVCDEVNRDLQRKSRIQVYVFI